MKITALFIGVYAVNFIILVSCGSEQTNKPEKIRTVKPTQPNSVAKDSAHGNASSEKAPLETTQHQIPKDVTLTPPIGFNPNSHLEMEFFRWQEPPRSINDFERPTREMTTEEGRQLFFEGIIPMIESANFPDPVSSEFGQAIAKGMIVGPACATTNSQVLKYSARKAGLSWVADLFADPWNYLPTHNNEYQLMLLGWHYFKMDTYVSPVGSVGAWTRYLFYGVPDHTGHIYMTFQDRGPDVSPLVGDNTRRKNEKHGHIYRPAGQPVGFWLPPGVYPLERSSIRNKIAIQR